MAETVDLVIIGAGTAGLSAYKEARKYTQDILIIDKGPLGSTCARVGCMPSKALLQVAHDFQQRQHLAHQGIFGADNLTVDMKRVLEYVRFLRDQFTEGVVDFTQSLDECFICGEARFLTPDQIGVNGRTIRARAIIIATGSSSVVPSAWQSFNHGILTSEILFEQTHLAKDVAVIGAGSIGLEIGQALARLGINITAFHAGEFIGGITDPVVNEVALQILREDFPIHLNHEASLSFNAGNMIVEAEDKMAVGQVIAAMGRRPNLASLGLSALDIPTDDRDVPVYDKTTMRIEHTNIYLAGDVNGSRPLLHEAADEGRIAAFNAVNTHQCFQRRTPLSILFTQPNIAVIGQHYRQASTNGIAVGQVDYTTQGRATIMQKNKGILRIYGCQKTGVLIGAECIAPDGEHLAHLLAWAIFKKMTVFDVLQMPFYHPVIEEGMRTALRDLAKQVERESSPFELAMCDSEAIRNLS